MPWTCRRCESINHDEARTCEICDADVVATIFSRDVIAAGQNHSLAILPDGRVVAWGSNSHGQTNVPPWLADVVRVAAGERHSIALTRDNRIVGWGDNSKNQLMQPRFTKHIVAIAAAGYYSCVLFDDGTVCAWGDDSFRQCSAANSLTDIVQMTLGNHHALALSKTNLLYACGRYPNGAFPPKLIKPEPRSLTAVSKSTVHTRSLSKESTPDLYEGITVGLLDSFALTSNGMIHWWDSVGNFRLLDGAGVKKIYANEKRTARLLAGGVVTVRYEGKPIPIEFAEPIEHLAIGANHLIAVSKTGIVTCWGDNTYGQSTIPDAVAATNILPINFSTPTVKPPSHGTKLDLPHSIPSSIPAVEPPVTETLLSPSSKSTGSPRSVTVATGTGAYPLVAAGESHTLALTTAGVVHAFGDNSFGQAKVPTSVLLAVAVAAGNRHSVALLNTNKIVAWGDNTQHQCAVPAYDKKINSLVAGGDFTLALFDDGTMCAWGDDTYGQCSLVRTLTDIVQIAAGSHHGIALNSSGVLYAWGRYPEGNTDLRILNESFLLAESAPTRPAFGMLKPTKPRYLSIAAGETMSFALTTDNTIIRWNKSGVSRMFDATDVHAVVARGRLTVRLLEDHTLALFSGGRQFNIAFSARISHYAVGGKHIIALTDDAKILHWDIHDIHSRSHPTVTHLSTVPVAPVEPISVVTTTSGPKLEQADVRASSLFITTFTKSAMTTLSGRSEKPPELSPEEKLPVWVCSHCESINNGVVTICFICDTPQTAPPPKTEAIKHNPGSLLYLTHNQIVYAWDPINMCQVEPPSILKDLISVVSPQTTCIGVTKSNTIRFFGDKSSAIDPRFPIPFVKNITHVSAGQSHVLALTQDGTVIAWGAKNHGQTNTSMIKGTVVAIAAGAFHSLALLSTGTVCSWGCNDLQQVTLPSDLRHIRSIAAGGAHSVALRDDGSVVSWGYNRNNQTTVPATLSDVNAIACGKNHTVAVTNNGKVVCWGENNSRQLAAPVGLSNITAITAGATYSMALDDAGILHFWGKP